MLHEIASVQTSGELSAHLRAVVLLALDVGPSTRDNLLSESGILAADLERGLPLWHQAITRANSHDTFLILLHANINLFALDEQKGAHLLQQLAALLIRFPAQANLAVFRSALALLPTKFEPWLDVLTKQLSQIDSPLEVKRFARVGTRMAKSLSSWLETRDPKLFLALPNEERKLLMTYAERANLTQMHLGDQPKLVATLSKLQL